MKDAQFAEGYLPPGTRVRYGGLEDGQPEYGVVVHCWYDDECDGYDCYIAFFGPAEPLGKPACKPYVLRYFASSLEVVDAKLTTLQANRS